MIKVACAPCSWGVESSEQGDNPSWGKVLMETREAGYDGIELGPLGYFPDDPAILKSSLRVRGVTACAGNLHDVFSKPEARDSILANAQKEIDRLVAIGVDKLLIMDKANAIRDAYIGHGAIAPRLSFSQQQAMIETMTEVARLASSHGIRTLLHPSSGGYVAFPDEIEAVMNAISPQLLGLCLDVGHMYIDGMKPDEMLRQYANRLEHLHMKDIDGQQLHIALRDRCGITRAYSQGLTRPLGQGNINFSNIFNVLQEIDYQGWLVVEHERPVYDQLNVKADLAKSRMFLAECGV
ncbi:sugar phosphate isomerase/epimerase family protein [Photobacterium nomapromontoriensis]|uniref:sugar phosphate isomerase/epimerase family protein n=1 Tax=Photobacterium nomapromontoriensis TaxID=2910237 RepID=UPI003D09D694